MTFQLPPSYEPARQLSRAAINADREARQMRDAADAECACAFREAEALTALLDRDEGTAGTDPEALGALVEELAALRAKAEALLGAKPAVLRNSAGQVVGYVYGTPGR